MKKLMVWISIIVLSVFSLCQAEIRYIITDLGTLGGDYSYATAINDNGQVTGVSRVTGVEGDLQAFLYDNGTMTDLGSLGGYGSSAYDINNNGQVVGKSKLSEYIIPVAFSYADGAMTQIGTGFQARGINNSGQVVGGTGDLMMGSAILYDGGVMTDLGALLGEGSSSAAAINDSGQVVGHSRYHLNSAFLYDGGTMINLGRLPGDDESFAFDINNSGQVVGVSRRSGGAFEQAFLYEDGTMTPLGAGSAAYGINDSGQVVGRIGNSITSAFLYDGIKGVLDLNDLIPTGSGWSLRIANDINSSGQIVGYGEIAGEGHAFLMTPVPEPATLCLLGLGGLLLRGKK